MYGLRFVTGRSGFLLLLALLVCGGASAQSYPAPAASPVSNGSFAVSYQANCGSLPAGAICVFTYLQEKVGANGAWQNVSSSSGSYTVQGRPDGDYFYRVYAGGFYHWFGYTEIYSAEIRVTVSGDSTRQPILTQLRYDYTVRRGDANGDGRTDLFMSRNSGVPPSAGALEQVLLQQAADGRSFSPFVPSGALASAAAYWPQAGVDAVVSDIDVDGYVDVTLNGVANAIGGAPDQIVFAPGQAAAPIRIRAFDEELGRFAGNMLDYFANQRFFADTAPVYYYQLWYWYAYCFPWYSTGLDYSYWGFPASGCYIDSFVLVGLFRDYSVFSDEALLYWANDYDASSGFVDEDTALAETEQAIESLLGTPIGGWPMEEILGPVGEHSDPFVRRGIEIGQSVLGQARGGRNATTARLVPPQQPRLPDQIYITGHPLAFARGRGHLALEYVDSLGGVPYTGTTISAAPEYNNILEFGKLMANYNRPTDHPLLNYYVGDVDPVNTSNFNYWSGYLRPRHDRYRSLPYNQLVDYAIIPSSAAGTSNSNGYVRGVTSDSAANVTVSTPSGMGWFYPGWNDPVPELKFR